MGNLWFAGGSRMRSGWASVRRAALGLLLLLSCGGLCAPAALAGPSPYLAKDRTLVDVWAAAEGAKLGVVLPGGPESFIEVKESSQNVLKTPSGPAIGETDCRDSSGEQVGPAAHCVIEIAVLPHKNGELVDTVIHEVFHVFQYVMSETLENYFSAPRKDWLIEGSAAWVESELVKKDNLARGQWKVYLLSPGTALFKRTGTSSAATSPTGYSAIGFFGHMESSHISPWKRLDAMFKAKGSAAAYAAAGIDKTFLDNEASVFFRQPSLGAEWEESGPNIPPSSSVRVKPVQVNAGSKTIKPPVVAPYADGVYDLSITGLPVTKPVLEVTLVKGSMRLRSTSGPHLNEVDPGQLLLCSDPKGCSCPTAPNRFPRFDRGALSLTGGPTGGEVKLVARKPCEVLLPGVSCETLLPGFGPLILSVGGKPTAVETRRPDGTTDSACAFLYKGREIGPVGEETFQGVVAPVVNVLRASTFGGAIMYFKIIAINIPGFTVTRPAIGDEAILYTRQAPGPNGTTEYGSSAIVRVHNVVAQFALYSTPGDTQADPTSSLALLALVAHKL
jgi:hypothetical protein